MDSLKAFSCSSCAKVLQEGRSKLWFVHKLNHNPRSVHGGDRTIRDRNSLLGILRLSERVSITRAVCIISSRSVEFNSLLDRLPLRPPPSKIALLDMSRTHSHDPSDASSRGHPTSCRVVGAPEPRGRVHAASRFRWVTPISLILRI